MEELVVPVGPMAFPARAAGPADGRLVLLVHGFPQTSWCWRSQLEALGEAGFRAVAFDQRGYSPTARPEEVERYAMRHLVADVVAVADELGGHRFDLVGHDWGGAVAWQTAARHPGRLRNLAVVSTPHPAAFTEALRSGGDQAERSAYMGFFRQVGTAEEALCADGGAGLRQLFARSGLDEDAAEPYVRTLKEPAAMTAALNWYRAASMDDVRTMGPVTAPTLYAWSTDDAALGREAALATARHVEGPYRFEVLEGVSHWIPEEAPDALSRLVLDHLAR